MARDHLGLTPGTIGMMLVPPPRLCATFLPRVSRREDRCTVAGRIGVSIWALGIAGQRQERLRFSRALHRFPQFSCPLERVCGGSKHEHRGRPGQAAVRRLVVPVIQAMYAVGMLGSALMCSCRAGLPVAAHLFGLARLSLYVCGVAVGFTPAKKGCHS